MALSPCLTCHAMISTWAKRCPQCGEPQPHMTRRQSVIVVVLIVLFAAAWFAFIEYKAEQGREEMREFKRQHGF